ncbi:hypothetical protein N7462_010980 [Penicillium macrosclerotiorum]|uniref:uncharacterized protein n=1 Tax=Penicillium macrosclerotiorum TaxID=303699 RepID=UPI002549245F|nr:uncharacterized protein N7462_010980 [Penicillium macrosclerotiorum]KAJ5666571.1 hypothetical protein N7462_010980 [Penicillium macrosclerotiorum]
MVAKVISEPKSPVSRAYLFLYNTTCAILWLSILITIITNLISSQDVADIYENVELWARYTQTLAVVEILHAATSKHIHPSSQPPLPYHPDPCYDDTNQGHIVELTRSPVFTTFTQVFARSVQVWAINYAFTSVTAPSVAYPVMLLAWSSADIIRYLYFAIIQAGYSVPEFLKWSRYSFFLVLYPIGIGSEWWLMYKATTATTRWAVLCIFYFFLGLYQRRKVLGKK